MTFEAFSWWIQLSISVRELYKLFNDIWRDEYIE